MQDDGSDAPGYPGPTERAVASGAAGEAGFRYRAHGLDIISEFEVPEFLASPGNDEPDLRILRDAGAADAIRRAAALAERVPADTEVLRAAPADGGGVLMVDGVGAFWVRGGNEIRVASVAGADPGLVALYTLGSAMGLALLQRGAFVMHGASVAHRGQATLIVGPSGAGKSTLAARLGLAGCPILGDDTVALWPGKAPGEYAIRPAGTSFKLWRDALDAAGLGAGARGAVAQRVDKFYLSNPRQAAERSYGLSEILVLERGAPGEPPRIEPLPLLEAVRAITENVYRPQFADAFGRQAEQFRHAAALAARVPVGRLIRPWDHAATGEVVALLRAHMDTLRGDGDGREPVCLGSSAGKGGS